MKSLALSLLLVVSASPGAAWAQAGEGKNDVERAGLVGRVKSLEVGRIEFTLKDGRSVEGGRVLVRRTTFDERGNKVEEVTHGEGGPPLQRLVYTYDAEGRGTGYEEYSSAADENLSKPRRHVYALDGAGRRVEYTVYDSDGTLSSRFTYAYDAAGNKTEETFYSWQGVRTGRLVYTYDGGGRLLAQTSYGERDEVRWKRVNVYDSEGRKTETAQYQGGTLRYRFFYKYDGKGRVKEAETREFNAVPNLRSSHAPEPGRVVYTYDDEKGTKEVATYDERGTLKKRLLHSSDGRGNEAGVNELNADGSVKSAEIHWYDKSALLGTVKGTPSNEFVYDARGNWTRRVYLIRPAGAERAEPYRVEFRDIVYY